MSLRVERADFLYSERELVNVYEAFQGKRKISLAKGRFVTEEKLIPWKSKQETPILLTAFKVCEVARVALGEKDPSKKAIEAIRKEFCEGLSLSALKYWQELQGKECSGYDVDLILGALKKEEIEKISQDDMVKMASLVSKETIEWIPKEVLHLFGKSPSFVLNLQKEPFYAFLEEVEIEYLENIFTKPLLKPSEPDSIQQEHSRQEIALCLAKELQDETSCQKYGAAKVMAFYACSLSNRDKSIFTTLMKEIKENDAFGFLSLRFLASLFSLGEMDSFLPIVKEKFLEIMINPDNLTRYPDLFYDIEKAKVQLFAKGFLPRKPFSLVSKEEIKTLSLVELFGVIKELGKEAITVRECEKILAICERICPHWLGKLCDRGMFKEGVFTKEERVAIMDALKKSSMVASFSGRQPILFGLLSKGLPT